MPISKDDFKRGLTEEVRKVLAFLSENKEQAFTSKEVSEAMQLDFDKTFAILRHLRGKGYVEGKDIADSYYYIFQRKP